MGGGGGGGGGGGDGGKELKGGEGGPGKVIISPCDSCDSVARVGFIKCFSKNSFLSFYITLNCVIVSITCSNLSVRNQRKQRLQVRYC